MSWEVVFHPEVRNDLTAIARMLESYAGRETAIRKLDEIEAAARALGENPHRGTRRDEIAPGLRAVPAGRRGVIAFGLDEGRRMVLVYAITYGGGDWMGRVRTRR